ncbi:MAG: hypothetical protein KDK55_04650 [Chlamydiia bacterium]|nr:hypothetical protein [Chlamydiia bacterium]
MKKMFTIFLVIFGILVFPKIYSYTTKGGENISKEKVSFSQVPQALEKPVQILLSCPPAKELLSHLQLQGNIELVYFPFGENGSNAMWRGDSRKIIINSSKSNSIPIFLRSILFEMHNASSHDQFIQLDSMARHNQIDKENYVQRVEQIEHQNALKTMTLINWAIQNHYFPRTTRWNIVRNFEDHYRVQQLTGHAQFIAKVYDQLNHCGQRAPYKGTIQVHLFSRTQKQQMLTFLSLKDQLENGSAHEKSLAKETLLSLGRTSDASLFRHVFRDTKFYNDFILNV